MTEFDSFDFHVKHMYFLVCFLFRPICFPSNPPPAAPLTLLVGGVVGVAGAVSPCGQGAGEEQVALCRLALVQGG